MKRKLTIREISIAAGLAAFSAITQLIHIGYQSPQFGMWIDIVAVTWIAALFIFDLKISFVVSLLGACVITLFAPDTWLGAIMKWLASFPIWLILGFWIKIFAKKNYYYSKFRHLIVPTIIGLILRLVIVIPVNYFFAIPIWTGLSPEKAIQTIPWYIIAIFNIVQTFVDVIVAWILVYKFRLSKFNER